MKTTHLNSFPPAAANKLICLPDQSFVACSLASINPFPAAGQQTFSEQQKREGKLTGVKTSVNIYIYSSSLTVITLGAKPEGSGFEPDWCKIEPAPEFI